MKALFTVALVFLFTRGVALATEQIWFTDLKHGDQLLVTLESRGCFHRTRHELDFTQGKVAVTSIEPEQTSETGSPSREVRTNLGELELTRDDLQMLDNLLLYYSNPEPGWCTSVDEVALVLNRNRVRAAELKYVDRSCAAERAEHVLTFWQLIRRLSPD